MSVCKVNNTLFMWVVVGQQAAIDGAAAKGFVHVSKNFSFLLACGRTVGLRV